MISYTSQASSMPSDEIKNFAYPLLEPGEKIVSIVLISDEQTGLRFV